MQGLGPSGASPGVVPCQARPEVQASSALGTELRVVLCRAVRQAGPPSCFPRAGGVGFRFEFRQDPRLGQVVLTHAALSYPVTLGKHRRCPARGPVPFLPYAPSPRTGAYPTLQMRNVRVWGGLLRGHAAQGPDTVHTSPEVSPWGVCLLADCSQCSGAPACSRALGGDEPQGSGPHAHLPCLVLHGNSGVCRPRRGREPPRPNGGPGCVQSAPRGCAGTWSSQHRDWEGASGSGGSRCERARPLPHSSSSAAEGRVFMMPRSWEICPRNRSLQGMELHA